MTSSSPRNSDTDRRQSLFRPMPDPLATYGEAVPLVNYPGAKAGAGVYQTIINQIPPHETFVEAFAGSGQIIRRLRPARSRIVIDADPACWPCPACAAWPF